MPKPAFRKPGPLGQGYHPAQLDPGTPAEGITPGGRLTLGTSGRLPQRAPAFKNIPRDELLKNLRERELDASRISQRGTSLCGPASLMFLAARHRPARYAQFVTDLYESGTARLERLKITPGQDCKDFNPAGKIAAADWVALASVRDSENAIFDYDEDDDALAGITLPGTLAGWLEKAGFRELVNETNLYLTKGEENLRAADRLHRSGASVCLFIDADGISKEPSDRGLLSQIATSANHWVVLTSGMELSAESVRFTVYTWGQGAWQVPHTLVNNKRMTMSQWLQNYYGFVACKP